MTGDVYLGRFFGIPFRLHWSWFLAVFLIAWTLAHGFFPQTLPEHESNANAFWLLGTLAALGLFVSILLHELGHAFVALRFGIPVRGIRLFVFGGVAELGSEPKKPSHEILIALGGPVVTLLLIVVYQAGLSLILGGSAVKADFSEAFPKFQGGSLFSAGAAAVLFYLGLINVVVLIFNMIPAFPLDGGRVLRGIVWAATGDYLTSTRIAGAVGIAFSYVLFVGGIMMAFSGNLIGGVWFFFLGMFLQNAAQSSIAFAQLQQLLRGVHVIDVMRRQPIVLDANLTLREVADEFFLRYPYKAYPVIQEGKFLGILSLRALQEIEKDRWQQMRAREIVEKSSVLPVVKPMDPVLQAMRKLAESGQSRLAVVEDGKLVGLLCGRDVMNVIEIRTGLALPRAGTPFLDVSPEDPRRS